MKTAGVLVVFWGVFLFALPLTIAVIEVQLGVQRFPPQPQLAGPLLLLMTLLALWASFTMAWDGDGTLLPIDPPRRLVVSGPYAHIRHPFVTGVVGQMVAIGIALGSVPVIGYAAAVLVVWYYGVRPREEHALLNRFGDRAQRYFRDVRAFRPRTTPYRP